INEYVWKAVAGDGDITLAVIQIHDKLKFYDTSYVSGLTESKLTDEIDLDTYKISGSPAVYTAPCQFAAGNGYLFVTHPYCDPFYVAYNTSTQAITGTVIDIKIRDFTGIPEATAVDFRPTASLTDIHKYNLY